MKETDRQFLQRHLSNADYADLITFLEKGTSWQSVKHGSFVARMLESGNALQTFKDAIQSPTFECEVLDGSPDEQRQMLLGNIEQQWITIKKPI